MKIELIGEIAEYYGEQNPDLAPLPKKGIVLSATEDELQAVRFPKMQVELALIPSETACNAAKLREALEEAAESAAEIMERVRHKDGLAFNTAIYIAGIARTALAEPPRNCDVGTAQELENALHAVCNHDGLWGAKVKVYLVNGDNGTETRICLETETETKGE